MPDPSLQRVPYVTEYFGPWLVRERDGRALQHAAENLNVQVHMQQVNIGAADERAEARRTDNVMVSPEGIAVIELSGVLMKQESSLFASTSTVEARRRIRAAARSKEAAAIVLLIDSPGGTAGGTSDLAAEVRRAAAVKPVVAYIEDLGASAAYWVASQADQIVANQHDALVGSLGTYLVVTDSSEEAAQKGRKVHVISTGPFKGAGVPGAEITDEQLEMFREEVFEINAAFQRGVMQGRNLSAKAVDELFTGRVWSATQARQLGLVDDIQSFDGLLQRLAKENTAGARTTRQVNQSPPEQTMPEPNTATVTTSAATIKEIKAACKGADSEFVLGQLEAGATLTECMTAWMERQNAQLAEARAAATEAEQKAAESAKAAEAAAKKPGTKSLAEESAARTAGGEDLDAIDQYDGDATGTMLARRDEIMRQRKCSALEAMKQLARREPELLAAANREYDRQHADKYRRAA